MEAEARLVIVANQAESEIAVEHWRPERVSFVQIHKHVDAIYPCHAAVAHRIMRLQVVQVRANILYQDTTFIFSTEVDRP